MTDEPWYGAEAPDDTQTLDDDQEFDRQVEIWHSVGTALQHGRIRLGISMREAARRAGLSDGAWRHLEAGQKTSYGVIILPNPRTENLIAAARAVEINPTVLFDLAQRDLPAEYRQAATSPPTSLSHDDGRSIPLEGLTESDIELIAALVERLRSSN
jgi:transcriptional regulator with XRE-family HTH domain